MLYLLYCLPLLMVMLCVVRCLRSHEQGEPGISPHSPIHYYQAQVGTKHTHVDIDMDDPAWAAMLEDELS